MTSQLDEIAIPTVTRVIDEPELVRLWLSGESPGLTEAESLTNLAVLLKLRGKIDEFDAVAERLRSTAKGKPYWPAIASLLTRLDETPPIA